MGPALDKSETHSHRTGILGGAFDPPHHGHLQLAKHAISELHLDELLIIPTGQAWHKSTPLTSSEHRVNMLKCMLANEPTMHIDLREIHRIGPTFTIDTIKALQLERPVEHLFLIIGADQAKVFTSWREWAQIVRMCQLVVADRPTVSSEILPTLEWHNHGTSSAIDLHFPLNTVSATDIRSKRANNISFVDLVHPAVFQYIQQHNLYLPSK